MGKTIPKALAVKYEVKDDGDVSVRATLGEGQEGAWSIFLGDKLIKDGTKPELVEIGNGKALAEGIADLEVTATVKDRREETDRLTLTVELIGGKQPDAHEMSVEGEPGDIASFSLDVSFV